MIYQALNMYVDLSRFQGHEVYRMQGSHQNEHGFLLRFDGLDEPYKIRVNEFNAGEPERVHAGLASLMTAKASLVKGPGRRDAAAFIFGNQAIDLRDLVILEDVIRKEHVWYSSGRGQKPSKSVDYRYAAYLAGREPIKISLADGKELPLMNLYRDHQQLLGAWTGYHYRPHQGAA